MDREIKEIQARLEERVLHAYSANKDPSKCSELEIRRELRALHRVAPSLVAQQVPTVKAIAAEMESAKQAAIGAENQAASARRSEQRWRKSHPVFVRLGVGVQKLEQTRSTLERQAQDADHLHRVAEQTWKNTFRETVRQVELSQVEPRARAAALYHELQARDRGREYQRGLDPDHYDIGF